MRVSFSLILLAPALACGQVAESADGSVRIDGDTTGLPVTCRTSSAVAAIENWFRAVATGDAQRARKAVSPRMLWVSVSPFTRSESLFTTHERADLLQYVERRARMHEHSVLRSVTFTGFRSGALNFGPLYFDRSADDLGPTALPGIGKGAFSCVDGLVTLSLAPVERRGSLNGPVHPLARPLPAAAAP